MRCPNRRWAFTKTGGARVRVAFEGAIGQSYRRLSAREPASESTIAAAIIEDQFRVLDPAGLASRKAGAITPGRLGPTTSG
jgi:hypothetical protein